ncbi:MAG: hypothetical protein COA78_32570 [Blastopirellula sp.]|nr:MAG: hypothetical protein COA78_32570 [Blastopirellula sp.]
MNRTQTQRKQASRRGTATVEFAVIAPVFLTLILGIIEGSQLFSTHGSMAQAARDGARLGAMDRSDWIATGIDSNEKIITDVKNNLELAGMDRDKIEVFIEHPNDPGNTFDLDDPANDLGLFELRIEIPYSSTSSMPMPDNYDTKLVSKVVFRNSRSNLIQ